MKRGAICVFAILVAILSVIAGRCLTERALTRLASNEIEPPSISDTESARTENSVFLRQSREQIEKC